MENVRMHFHMGLATSLAYAPNGKWIASGGSRSVLCIWDSQTGELLRVLQGHKGYIEQVTFSSDSRWLASAGKDGHLILWDTKSWKRTQTLRVQNRAFTDVQFHPKSHMLAVIGERKLFFILKLVGNRVRAYRIKTQHKHLHSVSISPSGNWLATAELARDISIWNFKSRHKQQILRGHQDHVQDLAFHPKKDVLASISEDKTLRLWDLTTGHSKIFWKGNDKPLQLAFSPRGKRLALLTQGSKLVILDLQTQKHKTILLKSPGIGLAWNPNGQALAVAEKLRAIRIWDTTRWQTLRHMLLFHQHSLQLFSQKGVLSLKQTRSIWKTKHPWLSTLKRAKKADSSELGRVVCLWTKKAQLEIWFHTPTQGLKRLWQKPLLRAKQLFAFEKGCVIRKEKRIVFYDLQGRTRLLFNKATRHLEKRRSKLFVGTKYQVFAMDLQGKQSAHAKKPVGISALLLLPKGWLFGTETGLLIWQPFRKGSKPKEFGEVSSGGIIKMIEGPDETIFAGYQNGMLAYWDLRTSTLLFGKQLHGPVNYLVNRSGILYAATSLGDHYIWKRGIFGEDYCKLLHKIRNKISKTNPLYLGLRGNKHPCFPKQSAPTTKK